MRVNIAKPFQENPLYMIPLLSRNEKRQHLDEIQMTVYIYGIIMLTL
jgi:hypothetical protein